MRRPWRSTWFAHSTRSSTTSPTGTSAVRAGGSTRLTKRPSGRSGSRSCSHCACSRRWCRFWPSTSGGTSCLTGLRQCISHRGPKWTSQTVNCSPRSPRCGRSSSWAARPGRPQGW